MRGGGLRVWSGRAGIDCIGLFRFPPPPHAILRGLHCNGPALLRPERTAHCQLLCRGDRRILHGAIFEGTGIVLQGTGNAHGLAPEQPHQTPLFTCRACGAFTLNASER